MKDKSIYIKNVYYMLSYFFQVLSRKDFESITPESFSSAENLFAAILSKGSSQIIKQGLYKEYVSVNDNLNVIKGKINICETVKRKVLNKKEANCDFDELSENNIYNRVVLTTIHCLLESSEVSSEQKKSLRRCTLGFQNVDKIQNLSSIKWNQFHYHLNNKIYEMIINVCFFVLNGMIQTEADGKYKVVSFSDEHMEKVFERFVLEYYRKHYRGIITSNPSNITWNVDEKDKNKDILSYWTLMKTDVTLTKNDKALIIDTKYYTRILDDNYREKYHSFNLYQIFSYVKNYDKKKTGSASGVLLYAKTDEEVPHGDPISIDGNLFAVEVLNLYQDFNGIKQQLDNLVIKYLDN